jgi:hypothetical protein
MSQTGRMRLPEHIRDLDAVVEEENANVGSAGLHALVCAAAFLHIFYDELRKSHPFASESVLLERQ